MTHARKSALVLGANGYVGYGIAIALARAGYKTYGSIRQEKYSDHLAVQEVTPIVGTFDQTEWVDKLGPIDVIINTTEAYTEVEKFNNTLFELITKIAQKQKSKPLFIQTSGIKIYGDTGRANDPEFHSVTEESPYNPTLSLLSLRIPALEKFLASKDFYTVVVVPGMIYGRGQSHYAFYIKQALSGDKIEVYGKPDTVWHGVHIDDLADVYVKLAELDGEKVHGKKYNVTNDKYEHMEDIVKAISQQCGGKHEIVYKEFKENTFEHVLAISAWVNSDKVRNELGWRPRRVNFVEGAEENIMVWKASEKNELVPSSFGI